MTQQRGELEQAVQQARKLERDMAAAEKFLSTTEKQISVLTSSSQTVKPNVIQVGQLMLSIIEDLNQTKLVLQE